MEQIAQDLFAVIAHGDADHRDWLQTALNDFFEKYEDERYELVQKNAKLEERIRTLKSEVKQWQIIACDTLTASDRLDATVRDLLDKLTDRVKDLEAQAAATKQEET